ncbi:MAG: ABC transporter ATP-binding protein [Ignavibacteriaceae bacterium]|nr:ABC transporter ATP-binding protein [Ignavibacteriaceae bacterium]
MEKIIEISNLTKTYKNLTAVNNLSLNVFKGDVFGFLGPNGAGKSTTIRMLLTLIKPTNGEIKIFDKNLNTNRNEILKKIGAIVEKPDFYGYLTAFKNLEILGKISGCDVSKNKIMGILDLVGLKSRFNSKVKTFSHGMKQRLGIAQALLHDPELIILDEPTTGLDPQGMKEIRDLITLLSKEKNKTIFLSSHILYEVELVANRMVIINKGATKVEGYVNDLLNAANLKVTVGFNPNEFIKSIINESLWQKNIDSITDSKIIFNLTSDQIPDLNKYLVQHDIEVNSIVPMRSLEEYFLDITEKSAS